MVRTFADGDLAGWPALTRRPVGAGAAWYLATRLDADGLQGVTDALIAEAGLTPVLEAPGASRPCAASPTTAARGCSCSTTRADEVKVPAAGHELLRDEAGRRRDAGRRARRRSRWCARADRRRHARRVHDLAGVVARRQFPARTAP